MTWNNVDLYLKVLGGIRYEDFSLEMLKIFNSDLESQKKHNFIMFLSGIRTIAILYIMEKIRAHGRMGVGLLCGGVQYEATENGHWISSDSLHIYENKYIYSSASHICYNSSIVIYY